MNTRGCDAVNAADEIHYTWTKKKRVDLFKMTVALISFVISVIILSGIVEDTPLSREVLMVSFSGVFLLTMLILMNRGEATYQLFFDGIHLKYTIQDKSAAQTQPVMLEQLKYEPFIQSMNIQCAIPYSSIERVIWKKSQQLILVEAMHRRYMEIEVDCLEAPLKDQIFAQLKSLIE